MLDLLEKTKSSKEYINYVKYNPDAYLCSVFIADSGIQFSFYSKKTKLATSFKVENNQVSLAGKDEKIFQKEKKDLEELSLKEVSIGLKKAKDIVSSLIKEKYPHEALTREIIILQKLDKKIVWNITRITTAFNIVNVKIDAVTGKILGDIITPALGFKAKK